jgi:hypothetical protein
MRAKACEAMLVKGEHHVDTLLCPERRLVLMTLAIWRSLPGVVRP